MSGGRRGPDEETALLQGSSVQPPSPKPPRQRTFITALVVVFLLISAGAYSYRVSSSARLDSYGGAMADGQHPFHVEEDPTTGLTGVYGLDAAGNYRLFGRGEYMYNVSGSMWNYLNVEDTANTNDEDFIKTRRAVGYLEGRLTCVHMEEYYLNFMHAMFEGKLPSKSTQKFLEDNYKWVSQQANARYRTDDYWLAVKGVLSQLEGILEGLQSGCPCKGKCSASTNLRSLKNPTILHLLLLNADGDLYQITEKFTEVSQRRRQRRLKMTETLHRRLQSGPTHSEDSNSFKSSVGESGEANSMEPQGRRGENHCSALIKLLPGNADVLFGHDTWDSYESASPRIIKRFRLHTFARSDIVVPHWGEPIVGDLRHITNVGPVRITDATSQSRWGGSKNESSSAVVSDTTFSSSPGFIASIDDFYVTSGGHGDLMVTETSLDIYSPPLVDKIHPESVLCWMRSTVANSLAQSGAEWTWWFSMFHSGTYINQWMIVDMKKFSPRETIIQDNLLTVLEEMPGLIHAEDQTQHLRENGYWASFNLPFYRDIFSYSGAINLCKSNPGVNCYDTDPRYQLFHAHQDNVTNLETFMELMTSNQYQTDPLSRGDPCSAISCRQDLEADPWIRDPFGAIDSKVSSLNRCMGFYGEPDNLTMKRMLRVGDEKFLGQIPPSRNVVWARNGPTHNNQTPFCWSGFSGGYGIWKETEVDFSHVGHPDCFVFPWQVFPPTEYVY